MLLVAQVSENNRVKLTPDHDELFGIDKLKIPRSHLPAVTHVDYSSRIQTVTPEDNPRYYQLIKAFQKLTGCAAVVNTSLNVRGEPIVCSIQDAYQCFMRTEIDALVLENIIPYKDEQPAIEKREEWRNSCELD